MAIEQEKTMQRIRVLMGQLNDDNRNVIIDEILPRPFYQLMYYDESLIQFRFTRESISDDFSVHVDSDGYFVQKELIDKFPIRLKYNYSRASFEDWLNRRALPILRSSYKKMLKELNLSGRANILVHGFALSLNDIFWVKPVNNPVKWRDINLYDHEFSRRVANIAVGKVEYIAEKTNTTLSPEYTTSGILPKFWKRENDSIFLYKQGERESAREVVASCILRILGVNHVEYTCSFLEGSPYSRCEIFTGRFVGHVPFFDLYAGIDRPLDSIRAYEEIFFETSVDFQEFRTMVVCDYVMQNVDRHFNNFGFQIDNISNKIVGFSPLFDHGLCLFGKLEFGEEREINLKSLPNNIDQLSFIKDSMTSDLKYGIEKLRYSCEFGEELHFLCQELLENKYWNRWSCDNSLNWVKKCCDVLLNNKGLLNWNRYLDPSYMEIF